MSCVRIGPNPENFVEIVIGGREHDATDYWDGNWVVATVVVKIGNFSARIDASLRSEEFEQFHTELSQLNKTLSGEASFETMERQLSIKIFGDGIGHLQCTGTVVDYHRRNRFEFSFGFDQTELPPILRELRELNEAYPVVGQP